MCDARFHTDGRSAMTAPLHHAFEHRCHGVETGLVR
jgi:hypothetical protein